MANAPDFTAYLAYGVVVGISTSDVVKVYFPDFRDAGATKDPWYDGALDPASVRKGDIIELDLNKDLISANDAADFVGPIGNDNLTALKRAYEKSAPLSGRVALAKRHWDSLANKPSGIDERRLQINCYRDSTTGEWRGYYGFAYTISDTITQGSRVIRKVAFRNWMDDPIAEAWVDLDDQALFDTDHTESPGTGPGYVFVALDKMGSMALGSPLTFLTLSKVPWGGGM